MLNKILWYLKQLIPLKYKSFYVDNDNTFVLCTWIMWFGNCYKVTAKKLGKQKGF